MFGRSSLSQVGADESFGEAKASRKDRWRLLLGNQCVHEVQEAGQIAIVVAADGEEGDWYAGRNADGILDVQALKRNRSLSKDSH